MKRSTIATVAVMLAVTLWTSASMALDAYQDRRGFYFGLEGIGGGALSSDTDGFGGGGGLVFGGGATQNFTIEVNLDCMYLTLGDGAVTLAGGPRASYFVWEGLFLRAGGEFGWFHSGDLDDMTIAPAAGLGYEVFFNSDAAGALGLKYSHMFILDEPDVDFIAMTVEIRWY